MGVLGQKVGREGGTTGEGVGTADGVHLHSGPLNISFIYSGLNCL